MNIIYDTNEIGFINKYHPTGKTGIYRYTVELLKEFNKIKDINIYAMCTPQYFYEVEEYLNKHNIKAKFINANIESINHPKIININNNFQISHTPCSFSYSDNFYNLSNLTKNKLFYTVHDIIPLIYPEFCSGILIELMKNNQRRITERDFIIADSYATKEDFCNYYDFNPNNIFVVYLGFDPNVFYEDKNEEVLKKFNLHNKKYILSVSTFEIRKNFPHVIESMKKLKSEDIYLVLTGNQQLCTKEAIKSATRDIEDRVIFTDFVTKDELRAIYSSAQAFIYPSLYEGFGLPIIEAMACGTPTIVSNNSSLKEIGTGYSALITGKNVNETSDVIFNIVNSDSIKNELKIKGLKRCADFSWGKCAKETYNIYNTVLGINPTS